MQVKVERVLSMVGEKTGVVASVEEVGLGHGHEFMHEHEQEGMLAFLGSRWQWRISGRSPAEEVETRVGTLKLLI